VAELINIQGAVLAELSKDLNDKVVAPAVAELKAAGLSNEEIRLELDRLFFDAFRGLHGFPESHRP
jgi:hypothetical protein